MTQTETAPVADRQVVDTAPTGSSDPVGPSRLDAQLAPDRAATAWLQRSRWAELLSLERPDDRLRLVIALVVLALVSPFIRLPGGLPAIQLEQILLLLAAIPVIALLARHREMRTFTLVDGGFVALATSTLVTILLAPVIVAGVDRSARDVFEIVRIAEYWLAFRIGLTLVPPGAASLRAVRILAIAALLLGLLAVLQYLDPPIFNDVVTAVWTQTHNLLGVTREGRAVGTAGNANQFGMLAVLLLFVALAGRIATPRGRGAWLWSLAIAGSTVGLVLAQSRGAIAGMVVGLLVAAILLAIRRSFREAFVAALPGIAVASMVLVPLLVLAPPDSGSIARRFNFADIARDPSVVVRIGRIQSLVDTSGGSGTDGAGAAVDCTGEEPASPTPRPGHEPGTAAPPSASPTEVLAVTAAVAAFYCDNRTWPTELVGDLIPRYLHSVPPSLGRDFGLYSSARGFSVGRASSVEDRRETPGAGSLPNLLDNPSFEGAGAVSSWLATPGGSLTASAADAAFGSGAGDASLPGGGGVYQLLVADLPPDTVHTAGIWIRPVGPADTPMQLYVTAVTADGTTIDPLAARADEIRAGDGWQHLAVSFATPASRLTAIQVIVRAPERPAHVLLDGASLTEGPFAIPFGVLSDAPAASVNAGPSFQDSPIIGIGPQKDESPAVFDNEYASFLAHYGLLGLAAYGLVFLAGFLVGLQGAIRVPRWGGVLAVALGAFTVAMAVFAVSAGSYRQLQVMVIYWLVVGMVAAILAAHQASKLGRADPV